MSYTVSLEDSHRAPEIVVVGCGGTGGFVAEGLCRVLKNYDLRLMLVDPDRVEPHNLLRQNFYDGDVGKFKSQVLAERLATQYGRRIGYSVEPYDADMFNRSWGRGMIEQNLAVFVIGCVDNSLARRSIAGKGSDNSSFRRRWWLDAGNGFASGQVLLGNTRTVAGLDEAFDEHAHTVSKLPLPSMQLPSLLAPLPKTKVPARDCAEAIDIEEQSPTINQAIAVLVLDFMQRLLRGTLTNMGAYLDLDTGTLQMVPADPVTVARMVSVKVERLMGNACAMGGRYHMEAPEDGDD